MAEGIATADLPGRAIAWRDVLHEGPVPGEVDDDALREARARFLAGEGWTTLAAVRRDLAERDVALDAATGTVVLWFEHDLYDQLQRLQVLDRLGRRPDRPRVEAVDDSTWLSPLPPEAIARRFAERRPVPEAAFDAAREAWAGFRRPDPRALVLLSTQEIPSLPGLASAIGRLLEELPDPRSGLGRSERQAMEAVADGAGTVRAAFRASSEREEAVFMGDLVFVSLLRRLAEGPAPLVERTDGGRIAPEDADVLDAPLAPTAVGERVLRGAADRVAVHGIDRWIGGTRLAGHHVAWRWDAEGSRLASRA